MRAPVIRTAAVYAGIAPLSPKCRCTTVAAANVPDACPEGNDRGSPSGRVRLIACLSANVDDAGNQLRLDQVAAERGDAWTIEGAPDRVGRQSAAAKQPLLPSHARPRLERRLQERRAGSRIRQVLVEWRRKQRKGGGRREDATRIPSTPPTSGRRQSSERAIAPLRARRFGGRGRSCAHAGPGATLRHASRQMLLTKETLIGLVRRIGVISLLALAQASVLVAQQRPVKRPIPSGTSGISGRVIDRITKEPVAGCQLAVNGSGFFSTRRVRRRWHISAQEHRRRRVLLQHQCPAHLMSCLPTDWPATRAEAEEVLKRTCLIDVVRDQQRDAVNFLVTPGAIARGRVVTFDGRPIPRASVRLGRGMRAESAPTGVARATTDSEGRFEMTSLPAGEWRLEVEIPPVPGGLTPPVVYYPGGLSWEDAVGVELIAGKVAGNLEITVPRINENTLTVSVPPSDGTIADVVVSVLQQSPLVARRLPLNADGIGALKGIVPGRYFALALASSSDRRWAGFEVVDFLEGNYEARLQLLPTGSIAGQDRRRPRRGARLRRCHGHGSVDA